MSKDAQVFAFFVDGNRYETESRSLLGVAIKKAAGTPLSYELYLDEEGNIADKLVRDGDAIYIEGRTKYFYVVPHP